ncbi:RidA family protein [Zobellella iuensis]|uniref:RidA family protein n=1 Tax=Zobellella iuensis TaxID=2803811 RepID=A0ABS1QRD9_9GAMM|nr:RidA family protein [Zobellella iuensis]MBL1377439.1 RidA family protein [Zobellella iuensis]
MHTIEHRLTELGITLPEAGHPAGNYQACLQLGARLLLSGQTCKLNGTLVYAGQVGGALSLEEGQAAARLCALNLLAQLKMACGGELGRVERCVKLTVFVNCPPGFSAQPLVANGASDLMVEVFGERGAHVRSAVGVCALPGNAAVEIDAEFQLVS